MKRKRTSTKMRRGIYILPNLFTTGNLMAGFWSIISVLQDQYHFAALAILAAAVFDFFDGKVAKLSGATSKFGMQYDSLADIVSFGIAPALLAFGWALRPYGEWGWLAAFTFVACGGIRLARFNVLASSGDTKYFKGLPIPVAAAMVAFTILLYIKHIETAWAKDIIVLVMVYVLAFLMVSNIRYYTFKELDLAKRKPLSTLVCAVLALTVIVMRPTLMLFVLVLLYVFSGPTGMLIAWQKKRALRKMEVVPEEDLLIRG
jgi:CDP-diacylglycerol---serine O-phosphatidyltransferase